MSDGINILYASITNFFVVILFIAISLFSNQCTSHAFELVCSVQVSFSHFRFIINLLKEKKTTHHSIQWHNSSIFVESLCIMYKMESKRSNRYNKNKTFDWKLDERMCTQVILFYINLILVQYRGVECVWLLVLIQSF